MTPRQGDSSGHGSSVKLEEIFKKRYCTYVLVRKPLSKYPITLCSAFTLDKASLALSNFPKRRCWRFGPELQKGFPFA